MLYAFYQQFGVCIPAHFLSRRFYQVAVSSVSVTSGTVNTGCWLMFAHEYACQSTCCVLVTRDFVFEQITHSVDLVVIL